MVVWLLSGLEVRGLGNPMYLQQEPGIQMAKSQTIQTAKVPENPASVLGPRLSP